MYIFIAAIAFSLTNNTTQTVSTLMFPPASGEWFQKLSDPISPSSTGTGQVGICNILFTPLFITVSHV